MGADRPVLLLHVLFVAFVLLAPHAAAEPAKPTAVVTVSGPEEVRLEGGEDTEFQLHVAARLECARGFEPPRDLTLFPSKVASDQANGDLWSVSPSMVTLEWEPSSGEPNVYLLDELVTFNITSDSEPAAPVESEAVMMIREVEGTKAQLHCAVDGYGLQMESHEMSFVVVPQAVDGESTMGEDAPPVRWVPMVLALAILGALAVFATVRERQRRRGG